MRKLPFLILSYIVSILSSIKIKRNFRRLNKNQKKFVYYGSESEYIKLNKILDNDERKFNLEMVELEDLTTQDIEDVKDLISNHVKYTSSVLAKKILNDWSKNSKKFIKVMPTDYKKALKILAKEKKINA